MKKNASIQPILPIIGLSFILRLISINQSLWLDEATSANVARYLSFSNIIFKFTPGDFHPPFYYLILKTWVIFFGSSEFSIRFPSIVFGILTVFLVYKVGGLLFNREVGLISSLFLATAPLHIYYSQEARMYSFTTFLVTLLFYVWIRASKDIKSKKWWYLFSMTLLAIGMTDYVALLSIAPIFLYTYVKDRKNIKRLLYATMPLLGGFIIYLPIFTNQVKNAMSVQQIGSGWWNILGQSNVKNILLVPIKFFLGRISFSNKLLYMTISGGSVLGATYISTRSKNSNEKIQVVGWLLVPIVVLAFIGLFIPVFTYFRLLFCLPALYLLVSLGLYSINKKKFLPLLVLFLFFNLFCSYIYFSNYSFQREDWRDLVKTVESNSDHTNSAVVFPSNSQMEAYKYYSRKILPIPGMQLTGDKDTVWYVRYVVDIFDPTETTLKHIEELGYIKEREFAFNGVVVWKYNISR